MFNKTAEEVTEGTYYQDPFVIGGKATLHYYGGYMAYSTKSGDYVSSLRPMSPYREYEREEVLEGYQDVLLNRYTVTGAAFTGDTQTYVHKEPIYKTVVHDVTPAYVPFGREIEVGDRVASGGVGNYFGDVRTVDAINDEWIQVDGMYIPWSSNVTLKRV